MVIIPIKNLPIVYVTSYRLRLDENGDLLMASVKVLGRC